MIGALYFQMLHKRKFTHIKRIIRKIWLNANLTSTSVCPGSCFQLFVFEHFPTMKLEESSQTAVVAS